MSEVSQMVVLKAKNRAYLHSIQMKELFMKGKVLVEL
jgi:hypothetical protein